MKKLLLGSCFLAFLSTANAEAKNWPHWYVGANFGLTVNATDVEFSAPADADASIDAGYLASGVVGYYPDFGDRTLNNLRFELEVSKRKNDISTLGVSTATLQGGDYSLTADSAHLSAIYDFDLSPNKTQQITPFAGFGLGGTFIEYDAPQIAGNTIIDNKDEVPSFLLQAGLGFKFEQLHHTEFQVGYKLLGLLENPNFKNNFNAGEDQKMKLYLPHTFEAGVRFRF